MRLSDASIKNPVFAVVLAAAMVVFGGLAYRDLGISQFPELDFPVVSVTTYREAASPETMDFDVTDVIEDAIAGIEGIDYVQSQSLEGVSVVTVNFKLDRKVDVAMQDVQNAVSAAASRLPTDIDPPIVSKINFNKFPVIWLAIHGDRPLQEINQFVDDYLKQQVQTVPGCGGVMYGGLRSRTMRVWLDKEKLHAHGLDAYDVWQTLRGEHVEKPAGYLQGDRREMNVRTMGEGRTEDDFRRVPILQRDGQVVTLGDLAVVEDGLADRRTFARFNRMTNVGVGVMRATGANVVEVCDEVKRRLPQLRRMAPPGVEISISTDYSLFIKDDIQEVKESMLIGILLTALVTYVFLGSLGSTLNVCVSIPCSLMGTFVVMKWCGFTVNFMTLLALSLSIGVVVDDAILVLENIYRRREHGEARLPAAVNGSREIAFAAMAATLSVIAIFLPVSFMKGSVGANFFQFGITVSVAVGLSLVIALTITPMLCSQFLSVHQVRRPMPRPYGGAFGPVVTLAARLVWLIDRWVLEPLVLRPMDWLMTTMERVYAFTLRLALRAQWLVVLGGGLLAASALLFAFGITVKLPQPVADVTGVSRLSVKPIGRELIPSEDQNRFIMNVICPVGTNIDYVDEQLKKGENILASLKDPVTGEDVIAGFFASVAIRPGSMVTEGILFVRLVPADQRSWSQSEVMQEVRKRFAPAAGVRVVVLDLSTQGFTPQRGYPVDFAIQGPDWNTVTRLSEKIREALTNSTFVADVNSDYRPGMPEVQLVPDRVKAAALGVSVRRLAFALNIGTGGLRDGRYTVGDRRYDVRVRYLETQRESPDQVGDIYVKSDTTGKLVPLRDLVKREVVSTLPIVNRYNHLRKVEITGNMPPGVSQGEAITRSLELAESVRTEMGLPESYRIVPLGNASAMNETIDSLWWCLGLGFVVAYMILAVQFNSMVHPFTVLLAVPFGVTGALATLWLLGNTLNMMSMIGMVLLAGLVKKNSIILVDYTNRLRAEKGLTAEAAVVEAGPVRLRPILMTSIAATIGAVPLALGQGSGAETRAPLARSIIGGSILATAVTLVIVPVFYVIFENLGRWSRRLAADTPGPDADET
jgi:multidrug efflux pump subunit AcrB